MKNFQPINTLNNKKISRETWIFVFLLIIITAGFFIWSQRTQTYNQPYELTNTSILPQIIDRQNQTYAQVKDFLKSDDTDQIPYGEGFNCVDVSYRLMRNANWKGLNASLVVIQYSEIPGHMIVAFPIENHKLVLIEPQSDQAVSISVGKEYNGRLVSGFYVVSDIYLPIGDSPEFNRDQIK